MLAALLMPADSTILTDDRLTRVVTTGSYLLDKRQLAQALGLKSVRLIDMWIKKRMIPVIIGGHRTRLFNLERVLAALQKFEIKAIGDKQ